MNVYVLFGLLFFFFLSPHTQCSPCSRAANWGFTLYVGCVTCDWWSCRGSGLQSIPPLNHFVFCSTPFNFPHFLPPLSPVPQTLSNKIQSFVSDKRQHLVQETAAPQGILSKLILNTLSPSFACHAPSLARKQTQVAPLSLSHVIVVEDLSADSNTWGRKMKNKTLFI